MNDYAPPLGDLKAAPDPPPYPREWTPQQKVWAYWAAMRISRFPTHSSGWYGICTQAEQMWGRRAQLALGESE